MWMIVIGGALLGGILGVFYLKDHLESPFFARIAYHELTMRLTVVSVFLVALGVIMIVADLIESSGMFGAGAAP